MMSFMKGPVFAQPFRPRMIMTKMTARITSRRTIAMRTATMGNSLIGLLVAKSVVVAANCFSAGCNRKKNNVVVEFFLIPLHKGLGYGCPRQPNMQAMSILIHNKILTHSPHCLNLDLNGKRPGITSDGNFSSYLIGRS